MVIELSIGDESSFLSWEVDAQLISEAHAHHIIPPDVHRLLYRTIFSLVAYHVIQSPTEESVA